MLKGVQRCRPRSVERFGLDAVDLEFDRLDVVSGRSWNPIRIGWLPAFANAKLNQLAAHAVDNLHRIRQDPKPFLLGSFGALPQVLFVLMPLFAVLLKIFYLFKRRLSDPETGAVIEFFAEDWSPAPSDEGLLREPGHQFEWVWLLHEYFRATRDDSIGRYAERLFSFGEVRHRFRRWRGVRRRRCLGGACCRHQAPLAANRIHQGLRGARRMAQ